MEKKELPKAFEAKNYEDDIYKRWEHSGFFNPDKCIEMGISTAESPYFSIVLPPPNVTGTLHMGHAAMLAIEDVMVRYHRMKGDRTLWIPGTDHAAIATQTKVEKLLLEKEGKTRHDLGRAKFLKKVEKFAQESHDTIVNQSKKMGSSLDWSREAFTLDEKRNLAVRTVFKKMYDDGLIYRGNRIVNWCTQCQSTLADDEVEHKEQTAKFYTFKYSKDFPIAISTTRPETKLGDTAVAVNPKDKRYKQFIGETFEIKKFVGGPDLKIKIIGDEGVDMEFGTGAVGVTPAHSQTDYQMYQKHGLDLIKVIDENGKMMGDIGKGYVGLTAEEARKKVVENLEKDGLMTEGEVEIQNNLSVCYRCGTVVEPLTSLQWFIDVNKKFKIQNSELKGIKKGKEVSLKELMQTVVKKGQIKIVPERFDKIYFSWIDNLRDWCISRQIWYGHQIPVWYKGDEIFVGVEAPAGEGWTQDQDTLDTWFSSGLWTFSTLGYPNMDALDLKNYHPTSVMETGYDILFFWVARMILMTTYTLGVVPFETVYLHGLVRDENGKKMSKSLGNVIDPLDMIDRYGTDATRLSLLLGNTPGNDMKLSEEKIAGFRNFTNKLWNISRFILLNIDEPKIDAKKPAAKSLADEWILQSLNNIVSAVTESVEKYNFSFAGEKLRDFTWNELADWYLEIAKIEKNKSEILNYILNTILKLWHPFMPFVTESIWGEIYGKDEILMVDKWPVSDEIKTAGVKDFDILKDTITGIRALRADYKIEPAKKLNALISAGEHVKLFEDNREVVSRLARLEKLTIDAKITKPEGTVNFVTGETEVFVEVVEVVDVSKETERLQKEIDGVAPYVASQEKKLSNESFTGNAPPQVVEAEKKKLAEAKEKLAKLNQQLEALK